jgi:hypothetical protein
LRDTGRTAPGRPKDTDAVIDLTRMTPLRNGG